MLTQKQQSLVDSLVSEFTKINTSMKVGKKSLLNWDEIYAEKDDWERTKAEVNLTNQAFFDNAEIEVERISDMLEEEFDGHFYIHHNGNDIKCGWSWYIVPQGKIWTESLFSIRTQYEKNDVRNASNTHNVYLYKSMRFRYSQEHYSSGVYNSIEELFEDERIIKAIKSHINK